MAHDKNAVCIVRPLPGHLSRFPFQSLSEKPLDHYLADGSQLFRQFLRFMVETQWLLSALVTRSQYRVPSGAMLLSAKDTTSGSRLDANVLSDLIAAEWRAQYRESVTALGRIRKEQLDAPGLKHELDDKAVLNSVVALRRVLGWDVYAQHDGSPPTDDCLLPAIHAIGYSLGGFTAQSVFMAWPFAVSTCTTLLAGGALRDLAPTAFAHPEEWQTVLRSLRYELDDSMSAGRFRVRQRRVVGIPRELFLYLQRIFYDVFEQEYRGSYKTRVSAYSHRLLFVVGGNDPIVRPRNVLESAPAEGINLVEIAGLSHFLGTPATGSEEGQRSFWLPEVAGLIARFSDRAADLHGAELAATPEHDDHRRGLQPRRPTREHDIRRGRAVARKFRRTRSARSRCLLI